MIPVRYTQAEHLLGRVVYDMDSKINYHDSELPTRCYQCKYEWYGAKLKCTEVCRDCQVNAVVGSFTNMNDVTEFLESERLVYKAAITNKE